MSSTRTDKQRLVSCCTCCACVRSRSAVYTIRGLVLIFALLAFGMSFGAVFASLFKVTDKNLDDLLSAKADFDAKEANHTYTVPLSSRYAAALTRPVNKSSVTLWKAHLEYYSTNGNGTAYSEDVVLRTDYFTCDEGRLRIQAAEGMGVVVVVLCCANFLMSIFLFLLAPVIKFPLALYQLFASGAAAAVLGLVLQFYMSGWCQQPALKSEGWEWDSGVIMLVVCCAASLIGSVLSATSCTDY